MASIRHAATDCARRAAIDRLTAKVRPPWKDWREDPRIGDLLQIVGSQLDVLRSGIAPALSAFLATRDPARGLTCVYLMQALVAAELAVVEAERERAAKAKEAAGCT